jgi:drug/metabolite transporter (DMT)-like permease
MMRITSSHSRAILYMLASTASFSLMNACIRLISDDTDTTVIVFWRNFMCVLLLLPFMLAGGKQAFVTRRMSRHVLRAGIGIIGMETWFHSVAILPLTQATALSYTAPLFTTIFAAVLLRERITSARILALIIGFLGAMVILRPDPEHFDVRGLWVIFATSMWALAGIQVKSLTRTEPVMRIVFYMSVFMSLLALTPALLHWQWFPDLYHWAAMVAIAVMSLAAQLFLARAYSLSEVSRLMPYDFGRLIFTSVYAWILFHEAADLTSWLGAAIIIVSAILITRHENRTVNEKTA